MNETPEQQSSQSTENQEIQRGPEPQAGLKDAANGIIINEYPMLKEMPPQHAEVVLLYASGMTRAAVAAYLGLRESTVGNVLSKYDITKIIRKGVELQKLLLANSIGVIMIQAIADIRNKSKDFKDMSVPTLMNLVRTCVEVQKGLTPPEKSQRDDTKELLEGLRDSSGLTKKT